MYSQPTIVQKNPPSSIGSYSSSPNHYDDPTQSKQPDNNQHDWPTKLLGTRPDLLETHVDSLSKGNQASPTSQSNNKSSVHGGKRKRSEISRSPNTSNVQRKIRGRQVNNLDEDEGYKQQ